MQTFLQELANRLLTNNANDLSKLVVMFPSLRARVFFNKALADQIADRPIWQPRYTTIDEIMERGSGMRRGERIKLISELYKIYKRELKSESFDRFYHWGEMLISDFDMIDKYMVDPDMLLQNISDIKKIEADVSYLTEEQELLIKSFWMSVYRGSDTESLSIHKQRFLKVWEALPRIYKAYRERLVALKIGYPGLIYRITAERILAGEEIVLDNRRYIVAGFNALSKSEQILFDHLAKRRSDTEFYWDYDNYYVANREHEAGRFMRENIERYRNSTPLSCDNFTSKKEMRVTACVSNVAQAKYTSTILREIHESQLDNGESSKELNKETAIVLTDENLLTPLLHSLPEELCKVNVTMGFPFKNTSAYSFIEALLALQAHGRERDNVSLFYHKDVTWILAHPYIVDCCNIKAKSLTEAILSDRMTTVENRIFTKEYYNDKKYDYSDPLLAKIFVKVNDWNQLSNYIVDVISTILSHLSPTDDTITDEAPIELGPLTVAIDEITKLTLSMQSIEFDSRDDSGEQEIIFSTDIFTSLLRRHLQSTTTPYEGKPLEGVQVLGILETRNIDFKNVIILSMTDANFPGRYSDKASFIPYSLRIAYGLPTPEEHEAMYAYYFYRLLQRAERVDMLYCSRADENTGECSRYIYQLDFESNHKINKQAVGVDLNIDKVREISIEKGEMEMAKLMSYTQEYSNNKLSPTALFRYIECPLKFYFASIAGLRSKDEISDKIDSLTLGNILHDSMESLYKKGVIDSLDPQTHIEKLKNREVVEPIVDEVISKLLHSRTSEYTGDTLLVRDIIIKYIINGILEYDSHRKGFKVVGLETDISYDYPTDMGFSVKLYGRADRIDELKNNNIQVIDYKSGSETHLEFSDITSLFHGKSQQRISNIFQTLLYAMILQRKKGVDTIPSLYYASHMHNPEYSPLITELKKKRVIERYSMVADDFEEELNNTLRELFDPQKNFTQVEDTHTCSLCDFNRICRR